jgi:exosortase/archaeosortase family protein
MRADSTGSETPGRTKAALPATSDHGARARFAILFTVIAVVASFAYYFPYPAGSTADVIMASYLHAYVQCAGAILHFFDPTVVVSGLEVHGRFSFRITRDCDGMQLNILFAAAVLSFPARWSHRLAGLAAGIAFFVLLNLIRLCSLYFVGLYAPGAFDFAHREMWPVVFVLAALGAFVLWAARLPKATAAPA